MRHLVAGALGLAGAALMMLGLTGRAGAQSLDFTYYCLDAQETVYILRLGQGTTLEVQQFNTTTAYRGTYGYQPGRVSLSVPQLGFEEQSLAADMQNELMIAFRTPSIQCVLISQPKGEIIQGYAKCPAIKHIPNNSYETNAFEFYPNRGVKRRRWSELVAAKDTLYSERFGIYLIEGDRLYMAFGWEDGPEKVLTGKIYPDFSFTIDQLEPARGRCMSQ